jgi:nucleoside-diphosphate-sugar epimerase
MRGIRCLVTGATGFLGSRLLGELEREGAEVAVLSRLPRPEGARVARWHRADLEDSPAVEQALADDRPEVVFHLASLVTGRRELDLVVPTFRANLSSTVHLLSAATRVGCRRIVLAGSMEEPEPGTPAGTPSPPATPPSTLYAAFFRTLYETPIVTARIFMAYGPGQRDTSKVVPASTLAALAGRAPRISSGGRPVDWVYVDDVARGLLALATAPGVDGETLDLGSGELVTVREVVERICRAAGGPAPEVGALPDRPLEAVRRADPARTFALARWRPEVALDDGIARTIDHYRALGAAKG